ncbi:hypothetical protein [Klebsiella quasipneumoniae]|uniref:hypothetical protein n=1 Tax=Klebsiella quasipneumoniae TaxID=1463165 RepID=UPI0025619507|nr:hypothetical protein [Klebsiella quasipneumoniae]MDL4073762.1 hypothetical protein [Klebsiella quasipneumoniae]
MQIPFKSCLESGMDLTYKNLKEKHQKLIDAKWKLQDKLQERASQLLREYSDSLALTSTEWTDSDGVKRPYVDIGVWEGKGNFSPILLPRLQMDGDYHLNFVIATTLDDSPLTGGGKHGVSVSIWYENASYYVSVGSGSDTTYLPVSPNPGGFYQVCGAIKALINASLDRAMPCTPAPSSSAPEDYEY